MRYRWLLFDADGTLFDYEGAEGQALEATLGSVDYPYSPDTRTIYREVNSKLWKQLELGEITQLELRETRFAKLFERLGIDADGLAASAFYLERLAACGKLLPGARGLIERLAQNAVLALITNGLADVQRSRLADSGVEHHFAAISISDEFGIAKPDRRILDHTLTLLGDPPRSQVLMIGDSLSSDIQGGINAGVDTCWYAPSTNERTTEPTPTHTVGSFAELERVLS